MRKSSLSSSLSLLAKLGSTERHQVKNLLVFLAALLLAGCLVPSFALAGTAHEYEKSFGPDGTNKTSFELPGPVAVDQESHDVYVADLGAGTVGKFDENGTPVEFTAGPGKGSNNIGGFSFSSEEALNEMAVAPTSHGFYVASHAANTIKAFQQDGEEAEFTTGSGKGTNEITGFGFLCGVAVDANGDIYAGDGGPGVVDVFAPSGEKLTSFSAPEACNVAVDSTGAVYVAPYFASGLPVGKFIPSVFPVTPATTYSEAGAVDPDRAYGVAVDPSNDDLYVDEHTHIVQFDKDGTQVDIFAAAAPGALTASEGIAVDGISEKVYVSDIGGEHRVEIFAPPPALPPTIESTTAANVGASSADLQAQVNPELFKTSYHFEYLTRAEYLTGGKTFNGAKSTPVTDLGSAGTGQTARAHISGLIPDTTYLFRVAAENKNNEGSPVFSTEPGEFTTFPAFPSGLPDGRAYEMVTPPQKIGEVFPPEPANNLSGSCEDCTPGFTEPMMPMQSAPDGEAVVYVGEPFSGGLAAGPNEYLSRRAPGGWDTQSLSPLLSRTNGTEPEGYRAVSSDLSRGVIFQVEPTLSPTAPTREGESYANLYLRGEGGSLQPLVTEAPPHRDPGDGTEVSNNFRIVYAGANSGTPQALAFGHQVFEANDALTKKVEGIAPEAPEVAASEKNLYEWVDGQLRLVNVLPGNTSAAASAVVGSGKLLVDVNKGFEGPNRDHAISADGSRIFWSEEGTGQVYVRIDGDKTLEVPGPGRCKASLPLEERACFLTASADGSEVLLSDGQIFQFNAKADAYESSTDLTKGQGGFQGILGASEGLSRVYFLDTAVLSGGEENANHDHAEPSKLNLYSRHEGHTAFIGVLHEEDNEIGLAYGDWKASLPDRTAQVTSDGRFLAFMSLSPLTGYDNDFRGTGGCRHSGTSACYEVFIYDSGSGSLMCASCNPSGLRPLGGANLSLTKPFPAFPLFRQLGNLSTDGGGRLFFESEDALSPHDTNGHIQDVYEWEPDGVGSCKRSGGCVFLISSGHSPNDSFFLDSTPSGNDVFFITREQLLARDKDDWLDVYDARVGGGIEEATTAPCGGEACRGPVSGAPPSRVSGSSVFSGPGNLVSSITPKVVVKPRRLSRAQKFASALRACAKKPEKRQRRSCRVRAVRRYGPVNAKTKKGGR